MKTSILIISICLNIIYYSQDNYLTSIENKLYYIETPNVLYSQFFLKDSIGFKEVSQNQFTYNKLKKIIEQKHIDLINKEKSHITLRYNYNYLGERIEKFDYSYGFLITKYNYSKHLLISSSTKLSNNETELILYDSIGNQIECQECYLNDCKKVWSRKFDNNSNPISYYVYDYSQKIIHQESYCYDSINRMVSSKISKHEKNLENIFDTQGIELVNYIFLSNNNLSIRREIDYCNNSVKINYFDKFNNVETLYFIFDKNGNTTTIKGKTPRIFNNQTENERLIYYDLSNRIIEIKYLNNNEIYNFTKYTY